MALFKVDETNLALARATIEKLHSGYDLYHDNFEVYDIPRLETSLPGINYILSGRYFGEDSGIPLGKLYSFYGPESSGKSTLAEMWCKDVLDLGGVVHWCDIERSLDSKYLLNAFGIDINDPRFISTYPDYGEIAFDSVLAYANIGAAHMQVLDSIPAAGTKRTQEAAAETNGFANLAVKATEHLTRIIKPASDNNSTIIYINQERDNIVQMGGTTKSMGKKSTGGNAFKFYPHVTLKTSFPQNSELTTSDGEVWAILVEILVKKNKCGVAKRSRVFTMVLGKGFSRELDILDLAVEYGVVHMAGSRFKYGDEKDKPVVHGFPEFEIGNGKYAAYKKLSTSPDLVEELWEKTKPLIHPADDTLFLTVDASTGEINADTQVATPAVKKTKKRA